MSAVVGRVIPLQPAVPSDAAALAADGWMKQTTIGEPRLSELAENYRALGYEVRVIEHRVEGDDCGTCFEAGAEMGRVYGDLWLRRRAGATPLDDGLF